MRHSVRSLSALTAVITIGAFATAEASYTVHMTLRDLVSHGDRIVRGTVLSAEDGTLSAGDGSLPIITYRIHVHEALKGSVPDGQVIELRLLGSMKPGASGRLRRIPLLRNLPRFGVGREYLFVLTRPSRIGLCTTLGLGQGLFELRGRPGQERAVNEVNNLGLLRGLRGAATTSGPIAYSSLVAEIRTLVGR